MMEKRKKFILPEAEIPTQWYNVTAEMKNKPQPMINPQTKEPLKAEDLYPLFAEELSRQEMNQTDAWIDIPEEVREKYKIYRPSPLVRATGLEKALGTPAHIYFKNESVSPVGSHKLNSALPQAYYNKIEGITNITTETGAGQWGTALAFAAKAFDLELAVYMVKISYEQKPYRRSLMQTWGAQVIPSPVCRPKQDVKSSPSIPIIKAAWEQLSPKPSNWLCRLPTANTRWEVCSTTYRCTRRLSAWKQRNRWRWPTSIPTW